MNRVEFGVWSVEREQCGMWSVEREQCGMWSVEREQCGMWSVELSRCTLLFLENTHDALCIMNYALCIILWGKVKKAGRSCQRNDPFV